MRCYSHYKHQLASMKSIIISIYKWITVIFPYSEIIIRKIYWKNTKHFKKINPHRNQKNSETNSYISFDKVIDILKQAGIKKGSLLVVHSSYSGLEMTGLSEEEIIDKLLDLVGIEGTLAMPVIRKFKGEPKGAEILSKNMDNVECIYNVKSSAVVSGILPFTLMNKKDVVISHFPLNPMCAVGPLARPMMENNLNGEYPSPHGPNSSWKFCYDNNAFYVGLGTDLDRHCTMVHVAEEAFDNWYWSDDEWYRNRLFTIVDEDGKKEQRVIRERKPKWGMLHIAEMKMAHDLVSKGIINKYEIDGILKVDISKAKDVVDFMRSMNKKGYPYYK